MYELWAQIEPAVTAILVTLVLAILYQIKLAIPKIAGRLVDAGVSYFETKTKIEVEQKWQDDLHKALTSAATSVVAAAEGGFVRAEDFSDRIEMMIAHAKSSVPDAMAGLQPSGAVLRTLALAKLKERIGSMVGAGR